MTLDYEQLTTLDAAYWILKKAANDGEKGDFFRALRQANVLDPEPDETELTWDRVSDWLDSASQEDKEALLDAMPDEEILDYLGFISTDPNDYDHPHQLDELIVLVKALMQKGLWFKEHILKELGVNA